MPQADSPAHEEDGAGELFDGGQEFLDRMAIALGGKSVVPAAGGWDVRFGLASGGCLSERGGVLNTARADQLLSAHAGPVLAASSCWLAGGDTQVYWHVMCAPCLVTLYRCSSAG
jgi:hypothetical protein